MVTIIIPTFNYAAFLPDAIDSCLAQDLPGVEVLVIDDGSIDNTPEVLARYGGRIRWYRQQNQGLSAARNTGMRLASHDWVIFLDADDILAPHTARRYIEVRDSLPQPPAVVGAYGWMIDAAGRDISLPYEGSRKVTRLSATDFAIRNRFPPIALADRRVLLELGGFDSELKASEDRDMWLRTASCAPVYVVDERLHHKRDHGSNMSRHAQRQTDSIMQVLEKARRNAEAGISPLALKQAEAICLYQSARMFLAAGNKSAALEQCLKSVERCAWVTRAKEAYLPFGFRLRFLAIQLLTRRRDPKAAPAAPRPEP